MLTFRRLTLLLFIVLAVLNILSFIYGSPDQRSFLKRTAWISGILVVLYAGISVSLAFVPCSDFHLPVTCHGNAGEKSVSITFDDGPEPLKTPLILGILKKYDAKATFFLIGKKIGGQEQLLRQMTGEGHLIGNHSYSHSPWFDLFPAKKMRNELLRTNRLIGDATGLSLLFFRPPFGVVNPMIRKALHNLPWQVICWNIRSLDTMDSEPGKIMKKILRQLRPGAIILLHDHTRFTEFHLGELVQGIRDAGFRIVPLDQLLGKQAYAS